MTSRLVFLVPAWLSGSPIPLFQAAFGIESPAYAAQCNETSDKPITAAHTNRCFTYSSGHPAKIGKNGTGREWSTKSLFYSMIRLECQNLFALSAAGGGFVARAFRAGSQSFSYLNRRKAQ